MSVSAGPRAAFVTVCALLFLTFLDTTIVSVTLGSIQSDLHAGVTSLQWVVNSYSLVFASLMLTAGTLGDHLGRKKLLVAGVVVFCAGSLLAALAPSTPLLIAGRAIMGIGAAASEPGTLSIVRQLFPEARARARAVAVWAAVAGLALALGPVIGGLLVGAGSWRAVFWFNLAVGMLLLGATIRFVPESADPRPGRVDLPGFVLAALFLASGAFAVISGENLGYRSGWIIALFLICGLSALALVVVERRSADPMIDRRLLTPRVNGALFVGFAVYFGIFSIFFFTTLYLQEALGYSGPHIAAVFTPMAIAIVFGSLVGGRWVTARAARAPMTLGCALAAAGILVSTQAIGPHPEYLPLAFALAVAGAGFGLAIVPATTAVLSAIPAQRSGLAASTINTSRQVGAVAGVAVLGSLINAHLTVDLRSRLTALGVPSGLLTFAIDAIRNGGVSGSSGSSAGTGTSDGIIGQIFQAAYAAFLSGLRTSLIVSAALILLGGTIAWFTNWPAPATAEPVGPPVMLGETA
jgi:EmrB/QacA subfamily drug resistance transporter